MQLYRNKKQIAEKLKYKDTRAVDRKIESKEIFEFELRGKKFYIEKNEMLKFILNNL